MSTKVIFIPVNDQASKLRLLCSTLQQHFEKKEAVHVLVPDNTVLEFVDSLLWRFPEESFLPHGTSDTELIHLSCKEIILNNANILFNLCTLPAITASIKLLYDFDDTTSLDKKQASDKRYRAYREAGFQISAANAVKGMI